MVTDSTEKAEILSKQFKLVCTTEDTSTIPNRGTSPYPSIQILMLHSIWSEESSFKIWLAGPDNIHAGFLKQILYWLIYSSNYH